MDPHILAALGDNRYRFNNAEEIQNCTCIAPVTERRARNPSFTGDGSVLSSSGRSLLNRLPKRLTNHTEPDFIIRDCEINENIISQRSGLWLSSGQGSFSAVGRAEPNTTKQITH